MVRSRLQTAFSFYFIEISKSSLRPLSLLVYSGPKSTFEFSQDILDVSKIFGSTYQIQTHVT